MQSCVAISFALDKTPRSVSTAHDSWTRDHIQELSSSRGDHPSSNTCPFLPTRLRRPFLTGSSFPFKITDKVHSLHPDNATTSSSQIDNGPSSSPKGKAMLLCSNNKGCWYCASDKSLSSGQIDTILSSRLNDQVIMASPDVKEPTLDVIDKNCCTSMKTCYRRFSGAFTASGPRLRSERHA